MSGRPTLPELPIEAVLPRVMAALRSDGARAVVVAPPGAGKTTRLPLALLDEAWAPGRRIILVEPRRLAARAAAARLAGSLGEEVGRSIAIRARFETRASATSRIEVVTEGVLGAHDPR